MKNQVFITITILFQLLQSNAQEINTEANKQLQALVNDGHIIGGAAGITIDDELIWQNNVGYDNRGAKKQFNLNTKTRTASIAKPMTAIAIMQLVEKGLIELNDPVESFIPDYPKLSENKITIKHLLSHTSGITGYKNGKEAETKINYASLSEALKLFQNRPLLFEPGTQYSYTTYGYTVLGVVIEKVTGLTFETYMQKHIWDKSKMTETGVEKYGVEVPSESLLYHKIKKGKIKEGKENNLSNRLPGGGFYSTLGDLLKFGNAVLNNTLISESSLNVMREHHSLEKVNNGYGFGWFLYGRMPNEGVIIGHTGEQTGVSAHLFLIPKSKTVIAVISNTSGSLKEVSTLGGYLIGLSKKDK
jgi:CubicO group peptidase (beta-lactamase class C family)